MFYDLTPNSDSFQLSPNLLVNSSGGLRALAGNDQIIGSESPEILNGNQGLDTVSGGESDDILFGGKEDDILSGNAGNDLIYGNLGNDQLTGNEGNDSLYGGQGNDLLTGLEGNDILSGDLGQDTLTGGEGADIFVLSSDATVTEISRADIINDFDQNLDTIELPTGLTFSQLSLQETSNSGQTATLIQVQNSNEILGIVLGVTVNELTSDRFLPFENISPLNYIPTNPLNSTSIQIDLNTLPAPFASNSVSNPAQILPIPEQPILNIPEGFTVNIFAENLDNPRWLALTPTGEVLVTETQQNRIRILQDLNKDGAADLSQPFATAENNVNIPFGMAFTDNSFYLGNTDAVLRFPYSSGQTQLTGTGEKIADLPGGGYNQHWTRNLAISPDEQQLYVSVGSRSNVDPEPLPRASIQVMNLDGTNQQTFASGLRNPVGLDFNPITNQLYTTVNERDGLGDDLVPDYLTGLNQGEFYGWPYSYLKPENIDPRRSGENPELVAQTQTPDVLFQAHSAPLGLQFYDGETFPEKYQNGAFVAMRGSWNRNEGTGYKIVFIPFDEQGNATGQYEDFLTGFLTDASVPATWGRPVGLLMMPDGSLLFTEEANDRIYRIQYEGS